MRFHYIARGVCQVGNSVLLAQEIGATNTFLPGGHIETGENAMDALTREIREEMGLGCTVQAFLGAFEHTWRGPNPEHHEINLVFRFASESLTNTSANPESNESHLRFFWCDVSEIQHANLLPPPLIGLFQSPPLNWASTIPRSESDHNHPE